MASALAALGGAGIDWTRYEGEGAFARLAELAGTR
jgi:hypothetical protein